MDSSASSSSADNDSSVSSDEDYSPCKKHLHDFTQAKKIRDVRMCQHGSANVDFDEISELRGTIEELNRKWLAITVV